MSLLVSAEQIFKPYDKVHMLNKCDMDKVDTHNKI